MRSTSRDHQQMLTERQAATWLGMTQRTLWQRRDDGLIAFMRDGRMIRYDVDELRRYVRDRTVSQSELDAEVLASGTGGGDHE